MRIRALWVCLVAVPVFLCGCGGGRKASQWADHFPLPTDTMTTRMDEIGRHGGRFVAGQTGSPKTFNPPMANETTSNEIIQQTFVSLTDIDYRTQEDIPVVAKSWEFSDGGRTVTFHLRRGLRFSDGHPLTSEDVKFCFDVVMDPSLHPSMQDALYMDVQGKHLPFVYSAPDSYTFVVTAPATDALILSHVSNVRVFPKHMLEPAYRAGRFASSYTVATAPESVVTSGPWRVKSFLENQQTVLERNPHWFGVDAKGSRLPYLDELVYRVAKDQDVAAQMFHAGELDGLDNVKTEDYQKYTAEQKEKGFLLHDTGPSFNTNFFWFNLNRVRKPEKGKTVGGPEVEAYKFAWFSNRDFRRAVSMAVDRDAIIRGPYFGYGSKSWMILTQGNTRWFDASVTGPDYDPAAANALLDRIGLQKRNADGIRVDAAGHAVAFTMIYNGDNKLRAATTTLLQDDLAKVGIKLTPAGLDFNTLVTKTRNERDYDACSLGLGSAVPSDPGMGPNFWKSGGLTHYWDMEQPPGRTDTRAEARIDSLFAACIGTTDLAERQRAYSEMSRTLNEECFVIWLPTIQLKVPVRSRFANVSPSPMPPRILWNSATIFDRNPGEKGR